LFACKYRPNSGESPRIEEFRNSGIYPVNPLNPSIRTISYHGLIRPCQTAIEAAIEAAIDTAIEAAIDTAIEAAIDTAIEAAKRQKRG
jgi:hypothetical protein